MFDVAMLPQPRKTCTFSPAFFVLIAWEMKGKVGCWKSVAVGGRLVGGQQQHVAVFHASPLPQPAVDIFMRA